MTPSRQCTFVLLLMICVGCVTSSDKIEVGHRTAIILGTFSWDAESNQLVPRDDADFAWIHMNNTERTLTPLNGARAAVVKGRDFHAIDLEFVRTHELSPGSINGSDHEGILQPGAVIIFETVEGNYGKFKVSGYRGLHDLSFSELKALAPDISISAAEWDDLIRDAPKIRQYHMEIDSLVFD